MILLGKFKMCTKCGQCLSILVFSKNPKRKDGLSSWCKSCVAVYKKVYRAHNKKKRSENSRVYNKKHKNRIIAVSTVYRAVRDGKIVRPNKCQLCNEPREPIGHHEDYLLPLAVLWLCNKCHRKRHKELKEV